MIKKWHQKAFAAGGDRQFIERGAQMLGMDLQELIVLTIAGMSKVAQDIGACRPIAIIPA